MLRWVTGRWPKTTARTAPLRRVSVQRGSSHTETVGFPPRGIRGRDGHRAYAWRRGMIVFGGLLLPRPNYFCSSRVGFTVQHTMRESQLTKTELTPNALKSASLPNTNTLLGRHCVGVISAFLYQNMTPTGGRRERVCRHKEKGAAFLGLRTKKTKTKKQGGCNDP